MIGDNHTVVVWLSVHPFGKGGPILAAKISPAGPILAAKWSGGTSFSAKIGPAGPILGGPILV